jgi:hexosaminidase
MSELSSIIPAPVACEPGEGSFRFNQETCIAPEPGLEKEAGVLAAWLSRVPGIERVKIVSGNSDNHKPLAIPSEPGSNKPATIRLSLESALCLKTPEAYVLEITPSSIQITAAESAGIIRGAASLWQLALGKSCEEGQRVSIQAGRIVDKPRFGWRGLMLDCARNFFRVEFIEKLLDLAALHKLNVFHWHLTDDQAWRLDIPSRPELVEYGAFRKDQRYQGECKKGGYYSQSDVKRVIDYAQARHILVVPEIELPGHSIALFSSHPEFSCRGRADSSVHFEPEDRYGIFEDILCAGNDDVFTFFDNMLQEVYKMFPGPYIHMGGDEAPKDRWLECPACRERMHALGFASGDGRYFPEKLQAWFMGRISNLLVNHGKRMIGWDEVVDGGIRKDTIVMSWRGIEPGIHAAQCGYDVVMCPQTKACYLDHKHNDDPEEPGHLGVCTLKDSYLFEPVSERLSDEEKHHILGGQANLWTELIYFGRQAEYMLFPRLCALSEVFWSPREMRNFEDFSQRLRLHEHRLDTLDVSYYKGRFF